MDLAAVRQRQAQLAAAPGLAEKIADVYRRDTPRDPPADAEFALYDGFADDGDRRIMERLQQALAQAAPWPTTALRDPRLQALRLRLLARLRPAAISAADRAAWADHVRTCHRDGFGARPALAQYRQQVAALQAETREAAQRAVLQALADYPPAADTNP